MGAAPGSAGHGHGVALEVMGSMREFQGHGASPEGLGSFSHPSKATSAGAELALGSGSSQVLLVVPLWYSPLLPEDGRQRIMGEQGA